MVLDYHEKKSSQKISERKPVQKNRPSRREPVALFALLGCGALAVSFGAGFVSGRYLFKPKAPVAAVAVAPPAAKKEPAASAAAPPAAEPSLTFYNTLPAGNRGVIGSGMNPKKHDAPPQPKAPQATQPAQPAPQAAAPAAPAAAEAEQPAGRFVVQVASYREKGEADATREKLTAKGLAAYVSESKSPDKGVWYRLRIGKHLAREEAEELASKVGKGAAVLPE